MSTTFPDRARGFATVTAIFVIVILASLASYMVSVSSGQSAGHAKDILGTRALQAAATGLDWGAYQIARGTTYCQSGTVTDSLPASTFPGINEFRIEVSCTSESFTEAGTAYRVYRVAAVACNAATCATASGDNYVERRVAATVTR